MRATRYAVVGGGLTLGLLGAVVASTTRPAAANFCPETGGGYVLKGKNSAWHWIGFSWSYHSPNDHDDTAHTGTTAFQAHAYKISGAQIITVRPWGWPAEARVWGNDQSFKVALATPFFNGKKTLKATSQSLGTRNGVEYFSTSVYMKQGWGATRLLNDGGNFRITHSGEDVRHDAYHDMDVGQATEYRQATRYALLGLSELVGPIDGCGSHCIEDTRCGLAEYVLDEEDEFVLDEDGCPQLALDENGGVQWVVLPQVATRLTSTVQSNGDGTITYLYVIENLTDAAIPFNVAQVPVSSTANGWSGTVAGNSSVQTSLTVACGDYDLYSENACLELNVDGATECNESVGGQIYVPEHRREFAGTCVITSITRTSPPARNHVTVLLSGGSAEDLFLFRQTATEAVCVGEMHGSYLADESYTIDSEEDAPSGTVSYFVSVGKGVNKFNSEPGETVNP